MYKTGNPMGVLSSWPISTFTHHAVKAYCAHKCEINYKKYKYLILGDDTLDTDIGVYNYYIKTIKSLGVNISVSKCTKSEDGYAEFAKRLFTPKGECTGLPIHILDSLDNNPEQFIELLRICISRGYSKEYLVPGFTTLISYHRKDAKMLTDILSLPKHITGHEPLFEVSPGTWAESLEGLDEVQQMKLLTLSRESMFWDIVNNIDSVAKVNPISNLDLLEPSHPLIFALSEQCERYLPEEAYISDFEVDDYWIYNKWMEGEYEHLLNIPSVNTYRFYSKGHRVTKCNFDVFKKLLAIANGNCNISLHPRNKFTNDELYDIALGRIDPRT
jgi:hypothetical protein